jgi:hypothetical protein
LRGIHTTVYATGCIFKVSTHNVCVCMCRCISLQD